MEKSNCFIIGIILGIVICGIGTYFIAQARVDSITSKYQEQSRKMSEDLARASDLYRSVEETNKSLTAELERSRQYANNADYSVIRIEKLSGESRGGLQDSIDDLSTVIDAIRDSDEIK